MDKNKFIRNALFCFVLNALIQTFILFVIAVLFVVGIITPKNDKNDYNSNYGVDKMSYVENNYFYYQVGDRLDYLYFDYGNGSPSEFIGAPVLEISVVGSDYGSIDICINIGSDGIYDYFVMTEENLTLSQWANQNLGTSYPSHFLQLRESSSNSIYFYNLSPSVFVIERLGIVSDLINPIPYNLINIEEHFILDDITSEFSGVSGFLIGFVEDLIPMFYVNNSLTFVGYLTVAGLGFGVIFLVIFLIERFLHFRA